MDEEAVVNGGGLQSSGTQSSNSQNALILVGNIHIDGSSAAPDAEERNSTSDEHPRPLSLDNLEVFDWHEEQLAVENYVDLGHALATSGELYRNAGPQGGLVRATCGGIQCITTADELASLIVDTIRVRKIRNGKMTGGAIPKTHLKTMLRSEVFLQQFPPLDAVTRRPIYLLNWELTHPGFNEGGGQRVFYTGAPVAVEQSHDTTDQFLDAMDFASEADRTNAVAAALTALLRNHFPGGKPVISVTSNKSHAGKDTVVAFAAGHGGSVSISYQTSDWALERSFVGAIQSSPDAPVINIENARLDKRSSVIASAFVERFVTDPEPFLFSTGTGPATRRRNDLVVAITTNFGSLSTDLMNRSLPIHLEVKGDIATRQSPIGNPKHEFLPGNLDRIEAQLRGMVEIWKAAGCPLDTSVSHPFSVWAKTIGGILRVNGFEKILDNYHMRRTADDPLKQALGLLGSARPDTWMRPADWANLTAEIGVTKTVIPTADRDTLKPRTRYWRCVVRPLR